MIDLKRAQADGNNILSNGVGGVLKYIADLSGNVRLGLVLR
jgi:hypothetical protein